MEKIIILDGGVANPGDLSWDDLAALGDLTVYDYTAPEDVIPRIGDASIILTNKTVISADVISACPNLKFIDVAFTGVDHVDLSAAKEKGIAVSNCTDIVYHAGQVIYFVTHVKELFRKKKKTQKKKK